MPTRRTLLVFACVVLAAGCRSGRHRHDSEYAAVSSAVCQATYSPDAAGEAVPAIYEPLSGVHSVDEYIAFALAQNAGVHAARKRVEASAMRVPQAASLKDPMVDVSGWPFYPNVPQTASGRMTADLMVSQEVPWFGKLGTKAAAAEEEVNVARARLAAVELQTIEQVKRAYYELYFIQQAIRVVEEDRGVLARLIEVSDALYRTNKTSQQDVLRLQAELSNVDGELIRMRQMQAAAQADLARLLHISPETPLAAVDELPPDDVPRDIESLYRQAVAARPELHAMLAEAARDRRMVDMARLEYFPDATLKFGWGEMTTDRAIAPSADGIDNLTIGMSLNLPIYRGRLNAAVREAEASAVATVREYDQMKDETMREVKRLFTLAASQRDTNLLFRESIIPKTRQALDVATRGYQVGDTDFADLIANWRELLRFRVAQLQLEAQLRQTLASLERVVGGLPPAPANQTAPLPPPQ